MKVRYTTRILCAPSGCEPQPSNIDSAVARRFVIAAALAVLLAGAGVILKYSAVPYMDMWDGYINFYLDASQGDAGAWWAAHVDHRLLLSRVFFWLDLRYFGGLSWLPLMANFAALIGSWAGFSWISRTAVFAGRPDVEPMIVSSLIAMLVFSYVQQGNIVWAFQIQFLLAFLVPLLAFTSLALASSVDEDFKVHSNHWFGLSLLFGVAAIGTMANGIMVLPLMLAMAVVLGQSARRTTILALASLSCVAAYLYRIDAPGGSGGSLRASMSQPLQVAAFTFIYVGAAAGRLFHAKIAAGAAGALVVAANVMAAREWLRRRERNVLAFALMALVAYVVLSGGITALGRLKYGLDQAMNERYATPSVYAVVATMILCLWNSTASRRFAGWRLPAIGFTALVLLAFQFRALGDRALERHWLEVAALALVMPDSQAFVDDYLYPDPVRLRMIAARADAAGISIFSRWPYNDVARHIGHDPREIPSKPCSAANVQWTQAGPARFRVSGSLGTSPDGTKRIWIVDRAGRVIGAALTGRPLPGERDPWWIRTSLDGFDGFSIAPRDGATLWCEAPPR